MKTRPLCRKNPHLSDMFALFKAWENNGDAEVYINWTRLEKINLCYFREAHAILSGKHWEGKNRCVKLPGDE